MVIRTLGPEALLLLMSLDRPAGEDMAWLLHGPTDDRIVEDEPAQAPPRRWAAE